MSQIDPEATSPSFGDYLSSPLAATKVPPATISIISDQTPSCLNRTGIVRHIMARSALKIFQGVARKSSS